mgnify:CR=1 FL=1
MNFEDFQKKVIDVTNTVGKKTNDLIEEGKLLYNTGGRTGDRPAVSGLGPRRL